MAMFNRYWSSSPSYLFSIDSSLNSIAFTLLHLSLVYPMLVLQLSLEILPFFRFSQLPLLANSYLTSGNIFLLVYRSDGSSFVIVIIIVSVYPYTLPSFSRNSGERGIARASVPSFSETDTDTE